MPNVKEEEDVDRVQVSPGRTFIDLTIDSDPEGSFSESGNHDGGDDDGHHSDSDWAQDDLESIVQLESGNGSLPEVELGSPVSPDSELESDEGAVNNGSSEEAHMDVEGEREEEGSNTF